MKKYCENIQEMLVDYTDGQLSLAESNMIEEHLAECENCRKMLESLQRSLELATIVWEDNLTDLDEVEITSQPKAKKIRLFRHAAVAAGILIISAVTILWWSFQRIEKEEPVLTFEEIEKKINDSASAARLLAATELLADYPDSRDIVQQQYSYILKTYPQTSAAEKIKLKNQIN